MLDIHSHILYVIDDSSRTKEESIELLRYLEEQGVEEKFIASERLKELDCEMLVQIHDELLFQCPEENCEEAMQIIRDCMIYPFGEKVSLNLPLEVGMGHSLSYQGGH